MLRKRLTKWTAIACFATCVLPLGIDWIDPLPGGLSDSARFVTLPAQLRRADADSWELTEEFAFIDSAGKRWTAHVGTLTDGASIPQVFQSLVGSPFDATHLDAAVMHDAYCGHENVGGPSWHTERWEDVHRMFYEACLAGGTSERKAKVMYAAVYLGGPRWADPDRNLGDVPQEVLRKTFDECRAWIEAQDPSPERIQEWMREREEDLRTAR